MSSVSTNEVARPEGHGAGHVASTAAPSLPTYAVPVYSWPVRVTGPQFWTLVRLAAYDWHRSGTVAVSVAELADRLGQRPTTTARHLRALEDAGLLARVAPGRGSRPTTYRVLVNGGPR